MSSTSYLVVGANRGIGLEFVRQLLSNPSNKVVATYRDASKISDLKRLSAEKSNAGRLVLTRLDMGDDSSCKAAAEDVRSKVKDLDVLVVNAGVAASEDNSLLKQNIQDVANILGSNVLGPLRITQHFTPLLRSGSAASPRVIFISSSLGSITLGANEIGPSYSTSKAALNMIGRKLAQELEPSKIAVALVHPGWVQTDMGGKNADISPTESVSGMLKVIDQVNMQNTGEFWQWDGQRLPW